MGRLSTKGVVMIALLLSFITAFLVYSYLKEVTTKNPEGVPVVVAKMEIPAKTKITSDIVELIQVPIEYIQPGVLQELNKVVDIIAREQIVAGEQITERRLVIAGKTAGFTGVIPPGKRAMSVAANDVSGVAGLIKVGDNVDVVVTFDQSVVGDYVGYGSLTLA